MNRQSHKDEFSGRFLFWCQRCKERNDSQECDYCGGGTVDFADLVEHEKERQREAKKCGE